MFILLVTVVELECNIPTTILRGYVFTKQQILGATSELHFSYLKHT